jgi:hypothetical protein
MATQTAEQIGKRHEARINGYLARDRRGQRVAHAGEVTCGYVFDKQAGSVALVWCSHEARCQAQGIPFGSDGPYNREPYEPMVIES